MKKLLWETLGLPLIMLAIVCVVYVLLDWLVHGTSCWTYAFTGRCS